MNIFRLPDSDRMTMSQSACSQTQAIATDGTGSSAATTNL